jgi:hypothetical protein
MLKGSTVKEVNVCFVDKWSNSISLINVQPEENFEGKMCLNHPKNVFIKNLLKCVVLDAEFWMRSFGCGVSMRYFRCVVFDALFSTRCFRRGVFDAVFSTRCFRRVVFDALFSQLKKTPKCRFWKKKFGVDWPRPIQFQKKFSKSQTSKMKNRHGLV